jgi:hypothetical protein
MTMSRQRSHGSDFKARAALDAVGDPPAEQQDLQLS